MYGKEYDFPYEALLLQAVSDLDAAALSHGDVQDDEIGFEFFHFGTNKIPIFDLANDLVVRLQNVTYMIQNLCIIVGH